MPAGHRILRRGLLAALALGRALAAEPGPTADDAPRAFHFKAVVFSIENDKFFAGSDRHYTQGARLTFLYDAGPRNPLTTSAQEVLGWFNSKVDAPQAKLAVSIGQDMFTPTDTTTTTLVADDRPYAAWSYLAAAFHVIDPTRNTCLTAELSLGVVGPSAKGEQFQNGWHDIMTWFSNLYSDSPPVEHSLGWDHQLHDEPGANLAFELRKRFSPGGWFDVVPRGAIVLGNVQTHVSVGGSIRFGYDLPQDFGHDLIRAGSGNVERTKKFRPYFFLAADARLVARNIFLDGNTWRDSHRVDKRPVVADLSAGLALNWSRFRVLYTQNYRTKEFYGQPTRDVFGSVSLIGLF
jgi:hypothetical protein